MTSDEANKLLYGIEETNRIADSAADRAVRLILGRLRNVTPYQLKKLKRELQSFNANTGRWDAK